MASTLQLAVLDGSAASQLDLLELYTNMLRHWNVILLANEASIPKHASESVARLISHANQLCLTTLQTSPTAYTALKVLDFYERAAHIYSNGMLLRSLQVTIPPVALVYILQFTMSLAGESRLCAVLAAYKQAFATYMANAAKALGPQYDKAQVNTFNGFLMDICNCLWRGKAFATRDAHARGCSVSPVPVAALTAYVAGLSSRSGAGDMALPSLFTMSYSPLLCLQAANHVRQLEEREDEDVVLRARHAGPVTTKSLGQLARRGGLELAWQDYRLGVLRHLEKEGFGGISELMYSTMRNLLDAKAKA
jgi:centromere protein I